MWDFTVGKCLWRSSGPQRHSSRCLRSSGPDGCRRPAATLRLGFMSRVFCAAVIYCCMNDCETVYERLWRNTVCKHSALTAVNARARVRPDCDSFLFHTIAGWEDGSDQSPLAIFNGCVMSSRGGTSDWLQETGLVYLAKRRKAS